MAKFDPKAKAKKQKIVLAVLGVVLLGVLVFQGPTILGLFGGGSSEVASEPAPPPAAAPAPVSPGAPAAPAAPSAPRETGLPEGPGELAPQPPPAPPQALSTATISVNGVSSDVQPGGTFPEDDPIFKLVSLKKGTAKVGIVDGTYATGSPTITLRKGGKPVTLMNTADGTTYVLRLVSVK